MAVLDDLLAMTPLLADGAMGTMLLAGGIPADTCLESLNQSRPELVAQVHADYVAAGARIVCTNTFGANRVRLRAHGLENEAGRINAAGVMLARRAASGAAVFVAGDVGPLGARLAPYGRLQPGSAFDAFADQIDALAHAGADLLLLETFADVREILEAVRAARAVAASLPVIATMTFTRDDCTLLGETPAQVAEALAASGADFIGINCAGGPAQAMRLLEEMRAAAPAGRFAVKPNAGWPEQRDGRLVYPATPAYFADYARAFADAGVAIVGGCCGTTPQHIAAMASSLSERAKDRAGADGGRRTADGAPAASTGISFPSAVRRPPSAIPARPEREPSTRLRSRLEAGAFVVTVEMPPPRGHNLQSLIAAAHLLKESGADAINVADSPMARMRMSPWAVCHLVQREVALDTVLHFPLRGRNLLRIQGDLLAAHALGIRNLFAVMGDPTSIGDHPGAMDAHDLVPSGLIRLVKERLNTGVDQAGATIGRPTSFFIGCALNLTAADADKEMRALRKKLEAGADFVLTQPVYEAEAVRLFLSRYEERHGRLAVPMIVGLLPLYGERHATFLHNEVPGISIPAEIRARIAKGGRDEGVRVAVEIARQIRGTAQGVYLMPPFSRWDMAAEIIEGLRRL